MKKKKTLILSIILGIAAAFIFAGCSKELTIGDLANRYENDPNYVKVTFEIGEDAVFNGRGNMNIFYYYKKDANGDAKVLEPGSDAKDVNITKAGSFIEGWYTDKDYSDKWDFASDKTDKTMTLYAKWLPHFRFDVCVAGESGEDNGKVVGQFEVSQGGTFAASNTVTREEHTLLGLYSDEACTIPWDYAYTHKGIIENGESKGTVEKIYSKWIKGIYTLVRKASDFGAVSGSVNYWLMNDIDFAEVDPVTNLAPVWGGYVSDYGGTIEGNGYAIKNIKIDYKGRNATEDQCGVFKTLTADAVIKNVKFESVSIEIEDVLSRRKTIGLFAGIIREGAKFENVSIWGNINVISVRNVNNYIMGLLAGDIEDHENGADGVIYNNAGHEITVTSEKYNVTVNPDNSVKLSEKTAA